MTESKKLRNRVIAILLIVVGLVLGVTWNRARFCMGDHLFMALGLPAWSKGTSGTHYPAVLGSILILIGIGVLDSTLSKKARLWIGAVTIALLVVLNLSSAYL